MEIKIDSTYKGTRILFAETAKSKRVLLNDMIEILESYGYQEIMIPIIQKQETFAWRERQAFEFGVRFHVCRNAEEIRCWREG